jgi:hypothetical protein
MNKTLTVDRTRTITVALLSWLAIFIASPSGAASFGEPSTIFYGKVIGTGSEQPFAVTQGAIEWTILRPDGVRVVLNTVIYPVNSGAYSYRLDVPHEALALGLTGSTSSIPLSAGVATNVSLRITVGGVLARLVPPAADTFAVAQMTRATTCRMDLEVPIAAVDSDGDGMPDWWENKYALDLQNSLDAVGDADGDGRSNLQEYRAGTDPRNDGRIPELMTTRVRAYAGAATGLRLFTSDFDTAPAALGYTVQACPVQGALVLRNAMAAGVNSDVTLHIGSTFSQADVDAGRLIFVDATPALGVAESYFEVTVRDENLAHPAARGIVTLALYQPGADGEIPDLAPLAPGLTPRLPEIAGFPTDEQLSMEFSWLGKNLGFVVWDASAESRAVQAVVPSSGLSPAAYTNLYIPQYGVDRRQILRGGSGNDRLVGGMEGDVLIGGAGQDTVRGNGGSDLFVMTRTTDGNDTIEDFSVTENDVLDLARVLSGAPGLLTNFVQLTVSGTNTLVGINFSGVGAGFTNMVITLAGVALNQNSLVGLVENGNLLCGNKVLSPRVSITASIPAASENGPAPGEFTLTRSGETTSDLAVNITISGSAANGMDYVLITTPLVIPAGSASVKIPVEPYVDTVSELKEVVQINVIAGAGYELGTSVAQVTIEDLAPLVSIEALEPKAVKSTLSPGVFLISRGGVLNRSVLVRLNIGGTAANGTDYSGVPTYVTLAAEETTKLITVTPKAEATLANGAESVDVSIRPDATYCVWTPSSARVMLVDELVTLAGWKSRNFNLSVADLSTFAHDDPGLTGVNNLQRYAFGLDPVDPMSSDGKPLYELAGTTLSVTFRKPLAVTDVSYTAEMSRNLKSWNAGPEYFEEFTHPDFTGRFDMVSYRVRQPLTNGLPLFMRVRLDYTP